jgi:hypothetical protein
VYDVLKDYNLAYFECVIVSRGPDLKRGPGKHESKRKIGQSKEILSFLGPKL